MPSEQRSWLQLPRSVLVGFILVLGLQIYNHRQVDLQYSADYRPLAQPFQTDVYRGLSAGSQNLLSYLLIIRLQLHDNQAGRHIRYQLIDYDLLLQWLDKIADLNPASKYPMLLATRVYSQTTDKRQLRSLLNYIDNTFLLNPKLFWRNQAEASVIAKHRLGDINLALQMAEKLHSQPDDIEIPRWARDMHFLLLADLNEFESSIAIIQALLDSQSITDPDEIRFLRNKLLEFQQKLSEYRQKNQ